MKKAKRVLAVLLAVLLVAFSGSAAFAAAPEEPCPTVYVHGFMGSDILADRNDPESEQVWGPDVGAIFSDVKKALPVLLTSLVAKDWERFGDKLIEIVNPYFRPVFFGNDGTAENGAGVYAVYPDFITKEDEVIFSYDWRQDPIQSAAELDSFLDYVCWSADTAKVNIRAHSFGGIVFLTYLKLYGSERINNVVLDSTAIFGEAYTGDLMTGKIMFDPMAVEDYLNYAFAGTEYDTMLQDVLKTARVMGLTKLLVSLADELLEAQGERVMRELLLPMFANWPSIWAMIPDKDVDASMHFVFDDLGKDEDRSGLREKVEAYNTLVRPYKEEVLNKLNEEKNLYVFSRTGYSSIPLTPSYANLSDGTVDTKYSSFGATTADFGKQLPDDVIAAADPAYISPEKDIDASTCMFPEQTWFIRGAKHAPHYDALEPLFELLLDSPAQLNVNSFKQYPRFMILDAETGALNADKPAAVNPQSGIGKAKGILEHVRDFLSELLRLFNLLLSRLKK